MTKDEIKAIALAHGFTLRTQPDGTQDLNPYVYAFAEALLMSKWQPIATAPKDQPTAIIVAEKNGGGMAWASSAYWIERGYWSDGVERLRDPTHWMPMPTPPTHGLAVSAGLE
jgi:hypothetical protein